MSPAAIVSPDFFGTAEKPLRERGFDVFAVPFSSRVDPRIGGHPDLQLFAACDTVFVHPDLPDEFCAVLSRYARLVRCSTRLGVLYPEDCPYNIAFTGTHALCRSDILPREIASFFDDKKITVVHTNQGYARCSTLIVDAETIITQDEGVARAARSAGLDACLVGDGAIPLKGFNRGFIGGTAGSSADYSACVSVGVSRRGYQEVHIAEKCADTDTDTVSPADTDTDTDTVLLTGSLTGHPDWKIIEAKIMERGKKVVALCDQTAEDFGSILFL